MNRGNLLLLTLVLVVLIAIHPVFGAGDFSGLIFESGGGAPGTTVPINLSLAGVDETIGNMDLTIKFNASILSVTEIERGSLTQNTLFDSNIGSGEVRIAIASKDGFTGDGSVASIKFIVTGLSGSSPLQITDISANRASDFTSLPLAKQDGMFTVLPGSVIPEVTTTTPVVTIITVGGEGILFVTEGDQQRIILDPGLTPKDVIIRGDQVIFLREGLTYTITTEGLNKEGEKITGLVQAIEVATDLTSADMSFGPVESRFEFSLTRYPTNATLNLTLSEEVSDEIKTEFRRIADQKRLELLTVPFIITIHNEGFGKTGPATGHFTVPSSLIESAGGIENIWFGHISDYVGTEFLKAEYESGPDQKGMITVRVYSPEGLSIFGMASAKIKAIASPLPPGATPTPPGQTALSIFGNMIFSSGEVALGNLIVGSLLLGSLITIAVIGLLYVQRKRGG